MGYWDQASPGASNLRLFEPGVGWRQHDDIVDDQGAISFSGSSRHIELVLGTALNASNLVLLTGAGASFGAQNATEKLTAPGMSDLWDAVEVAATPEKMAAIIGKIPTAKDLGKNIEKLLTLCKLYVALFGSEDGKEIATFVAEAERAILARVDFVDSSTNIESHKSLLRKIARRGYRKPRTKIFTTNYDLCFEFAAQQQQFVLIDGFSHSIPQIYDRAHFSYDIVRREVGREAPDYIENVFHLYKLHGSLDWRRKGVTILRSRQPSDGDPVLVYPRDSKYQEAFDAPYLDMMAALQSALREPDTALVISGFGFNDDHISKPIMAAIEANMSLTVLVCDVAFLNSANLEKGETIVTPDVAAGIKGPYFEQFQKLVSVGDRRITLLNGRFQDLASAIPDLVAQTERERHADRMQRLRDMPREGAG
jgi:hypothetical protein